MSSFTTSQRDVLVRYTKAIVHMRRRLNEQRFSLVFGAGISKQFGIPDWLKLIKDIARDSRVNGIKLIEKIESRPYSSMTQVLFHLYASKLIRQNKNKLLSVGEIKNRWRDIVREYLYKEGKEVKLVLEKHPYISTFIELIRRTQLTVTYNFDDYIEQILQSQSIENRIYETVWDSQLHTRSNQCVIYHPNGFLPKHRMERQSQGLIFCEDEFADQLIDSLAGRYTALLHHYSQKTCFFLGLSFDDNTLKHLLRQSAKLNPGHFHYYIAYQHKKGQLTQKEQRSMYEANFHLYNVITLFLTDSEINTLGELIIMPDELFIFNARDKKINLMYCYYIVGAIGSGKSSTIAHFRNLVTHDEWADFRISELGKKWDKLSKKPKKKVDDWIADQFRKKNKILYDQVQGIHIVDRAPLDPLAFTPSFDRSRKADFLFRKVCENTDGRKIVDGQVIILVGDEEVLEQRAKANGKDYDLNSLKQMQIDLQKIYKSPSLSVVKTKNKSMESVIKAVAQLIHTKEYKKIDLNKRLCNIKSGRYNVD